MASMAASLMMIKSTLTIMTTMWVTWASLSKIFIFRYFIHLNTTRLFARCIKHLNLIFFQIHSSDTYRSRTSKNTTQLFFTLLTPWISHFSLSWISCSWPMLKAIVSYSCKYSPLKFTLNMFSISEKLKILYYRNIISYYQG